MGFGYRVYKNFDPRAKIIKKACDDILEKLGIDDPVLEIAKRLEKAALEDSYFVDRKLYPNVDFYSGIIYRALGFPTEMFTVLFARSEEHTSELQSLMRISYAVFCLKKKNHKIHYNV